MADYEVRDFPTNSSDFEMRSPVIRTERAIFHDQMTQDGILLDIWADILPSSSHMKHQFYDAFVHQVDDRRPRDSKYDLSRLHATGWFPPYRDVIILERKSIKIAVYLATHGKDLYISWRAFYWSLSYVRLIVGLVVSILLIFPALPVTSQGVMGFILFFLIMFSPFILAGIIGMIFNQGDWWFLFRRSPNEFEYDDMMALTNLVHSSIIFAADKIGIDTAILAEREPLFKTRKKPRI